LRLHDCEVYTAGCIQVFGGLFIGCGVNSLSDCIVSVAACLLAVPFLLALSFAFPLFLRHRVDGILAATARMLVISIFSDVNSTKTMTEVCWLFAELIGWQGRDGTGA
jgi:hypothetical protein